MEPKQSSIFANMLSNYDRRPQFNWRHIEVGEIRPAFDFKQLRH